MQPSLELSIYTLLRMAFIWELVSQAIYVVGALSIAVFLYSNFKSLVKIIKALLEPYFQPQLPHTLVDKYGKWAGKSERDRVSFNNVSIYRRQSQHTINIIHNSSQKLCLKYLHNLRRVFIFLLCLNLVNL